MPRERARDTVWWPGLSSQINELVKNCTICIKERAHPVEPLMPSELPERPWQKVGADLFTLNNSKYILLVDYYSRFVEIAKLTPTRSEDVIVHLKSIFSGYGIPERTAVLKPTVQRLCCSLWFQTHNQQSYVCTEQW